MKHYFIKRGSKVKGPFEKKQLRELYNSGKLGGTDQVREGQSGEWGSLQDFLYKPKTRSKSKRKAKKSASSAFPLVAGSVIGICVLISVGLYFVGLFGSSKRVPDVGEVQPTSLNEISDREDDESETWDLLESLNVEDYSIVGRWTKEGDTLVSPKGNGVRIQIPYSPPEEYELIVEIEPLEECRGVTIGLVSSGHPFHAIFGYRGKTGLEQVGENNIDQNETRSTESLPLTVGERTTIRCVVTKSSVQADVGDKTIIDWKGSPEELSHNSYWDIPFENALWFGGFSQYRIHTARLKPINGKGLTLIDQLPPKIVSEEAIAKADKIYGPALGQLVDVMGNQYQSLRVKHSYTGKPVLYFDNGNLPQLTPAVIELLVQLQGPVSLNMRQMDLSDDAMNTQHFTALGKMPKLLELEVWHRHLLDGPRMQQLAKSRSLESIALVYQKMNGAEIAALCEMKSLVKIRLTNSENDDEKIYSIATNLPQLEYLETRFWSEDKPISERTLNALSQLSKLKHLDLSDCPRLNDELAPHLSKLTNLETLVLNKTGLTSAAVETLKGNLSRTVVTWEPPPIVSQPQQPALNLASQFSKFLKDKQELSNFLSQIKDEESRQAFLNELEFVNSVFEKESQSHQDCCIVAGRLSIPGDEEALLNVIGDARMIPGGLYLAVSRQKSPIQLRFFGPKLKPLTVTGACDASESFCVFDDAKMQSADPEDYVNIKLDIRDENNSPLSNATLYVKKSESPYLSNQVHLPGEGIVFSERNFSNLSPIERGKLFRSGLMRTKFRRADFHATSKVENGIASVDLTPAPYQLGVLADGYHFHAWQLKTSFFDGRNPIRLDPVQLYPELSVQLKKATAYQGQFQDSLTFTHRVQVVHHNRMNREPSSATIGLNRQIQFAQHRDQIVLPLNRIAAVAELGTGSFDEHKLIDAKSIELTDAKSFFANKAMDSSPADSTDSQEKERDWVRRLPMTRDFDSDNLYALTVKPGVTYLVQLLNENGEPVPDWRMFQISGIQSVVQFKEELLGPAIHELQSLKQKFMLQNQLHEDRREFRLFIRDNARGRDTQLLTSEELSAISKLQGNVSLTLYGVQNFTAQAFQQLVNSGHIHEMVLQFCSHLTDDYFEGFEQFDALKSLVLYDQETRLTDQCLTHVAKIPNLEYLHLVIGVTDNGLRRVSSSKSLKQLALSEGKFTGEGLSAFQRSPQLESIRFSYCHQLKNDTLNHLSKIPNLKRVHFHSCDKISKEQVLALQKAHPKVQLTWTKTNQEAYIHGLMDQPFPWTEFHENTTLTDALNRFFYAESYGKTSIPTSVSLAFTVEGADFLSQIREAKSDQYHLRRLVIDEGTSFREALEMVLASVKEGSVDYEIKGGSIEILLPNAKSSSAGKSASKSDEQVERIKAAPENRLSNELSKAALLHYHFPSITVALKDDDEKHKLRNTEMIDGTLALDGLYGVAQGGYIADFRTPELDYKSFAVALRFKLGSRMGLEDHLNILTGGNSYRWIGIHPTRTGILSLTLNNAAQSFELNGAKVIRGRWATMILNVDQSSRIITLYLDGKQVGKVNLPKDFEFEVENSSAKLSDKDWCFKNYGNTRTFRGHVRELIVFNHSLTRYEIKEVTELLSHRNQ